MQNKSRNLLFIISIYIKIILYENIICKQNSNTNNHEGKCLYISTKTGSEIINFHKFKNNKHKFSSNIDGNEAKKWNINLCNDTHYTKYENISENIIEKMAYDSQIVYTDDDKINYNFAGAYFFLKNDKDKIRLIKNDSSYIYQPQSGGLCNSNTNSSYKALFIFENSKVKDKKYAEIYGLPNITDCNPTLKIHFDIEYSKDYLILQKVLNDGYILTGILFILLGIYLCFIAFKFIILTKIIICLIFGQIIIFCFEIIFVGNSSALKGKLYILIIFIGILISCPLGYYSLTNDKFYFFLLAFSSGFVNGIYVFDICFIGTNCILTPDILIDIILIFTISFISLIQILPNNYFYYPPVIGSYILIRGISLLIYNASGKYGYRDLQLLLYLIRLYENDLVDKYLKNDFKIFWIYIIFNTILFIGSEIFNYFLNKKNIETLIEKEEDENFDDSSERSNSSYNINDSLKEN